MRLQVIPLLLLAVINIGIDVYIYRKLSGALKYVHAVISALLTAMVIAVFLMPVRSASPSVVVITMWMLYTYLTVYLAKYVYIIFNAISAIPALWHGKKWRYVNITGIVLAVITFCVMWWGALVNRYNIDVKNVEVEIAGLPAEFDGYTIAQISDLHVGTFGNDTTYLSKVVETINNHHPDVVMFTGDIVNSRSVELEPHAGVLSQLHAPDGVYSILGNHDYGDYCVWPSDQAKADNLNHLLSLQKQMGWKMLNNAHDYIARNGDSIVVIGVENIGDPPFHIYGSLDKAYATPGDSLTKILLSHNPAHWVADIAENPSDNIALTLSGHTHAMQLEVAGWSPSVFRYPTWGGLYEARTTANRLYVNIGIGTVGIPARIGATPEITMITLKRIPIPE